MIQIFNNVASESSQAGAIKTLAETGQAIATIVALIVGGAWTYILFVRKRQRFPRARVEHAVAIKPMSSKSLLVHLSVRIQNIGEVLLELVDSDIRLYQLVPVEGEIAEKIDKGEDPVPKGESEIDWPPLGQRECDWKQSPIEIEPGEYDEFHYDFVIASSVATFSAYSHFRNVVKKRRKIGWNWTTIHDTSPKGGVEHAENREAVKCTGRKEKAAGETGAPQAAPETI
jgi:hypothetical protein